MDEARLPGSRIAAVAACLAVVLAGPVPSVAADPVGTLTYYLRRDMCGAFLDYPHLSVVPGDPDWGYACGATSTVTGTNDAYFQDAEDYPVVDGVPFVLDTSSKVSGRLQLEAFQFSGGPGFGAGLLDVDLTLRGSTGGVDDVPIGAFHQTVVWLPGTASVSVPIDITPAAALGGRTFTWLILRVFLHGRSAGAGGIRYQGLSYLTVSVAGPGSGGGPGGASVIERSRAEPATARAGAVPPPSGEASAEPICGLAEAMPGVEFPSAHRLCAGDADAPAPGVPARLPGVGAAGVGPCDPLTESADRCADWSRALSNPVGGQAWCAGGDYPQWTGANDDTVFVTGFTCDPTVGGLNYQTVALDTATGAVRWQAAYDGPAHYHDEAVGLAVSPDGSRVYVTGIRDWVSFLPSGDYATVAYDAASGRELWVSAYDGPGHGLDQGISVDVSDDGARVYVTGQSAGAPGEEGGDPGPADLATLALDAETGEVDWVARLDGPEPGYRDVGYAVASEGSRLYVVGASEEPSPIWFRDFLVASYTDDRVGHRGVLEWTTRHRTNVIGGLVWPAFGEIALTDDAAVATGYVLGADPFPDLPHFKWTTIAFDKTTGNKQWVRDLRGEGEYFAMAHSLSASPDGDTVYVTGEAGVEPIDDCYTSCRHVAYTIAYAAATGAVRWEARDRPDAVVGQTVTKRSTAYASAVSRDGKTLFIAGSNYDGGGTFIVQAEFLLIAYDTATGAERWRSYHSGGTGDFDEAYVIAQTTGGGHLSVVGQLFRVKEPADHDLYDYGVATFRLA